jgi:ABC-type transport system substrate-binding protein
MMILPTTAFFTPGNPSSDDLKHNQFGPMSEHIKCSVWGGQLQEYNAFHSLVEPQVDIMDWTLLASQVAELTLEDPNMNTYARMFFTDRGMREFDLNNMRFPTDDVDFRIALAHCFDKDDFVSKTLGGLALKMDSPLAWSDPGWYNHACDNMYPYDLQAAVDVLIANGYYDHDDPADGWVDGPGGEEINLVMYSRADDPDRTDMGNRLATTLMTELDDQDWSPHTAANIQVTNLNSPKSTCFQKVMVEFDYHIYTGGWSLGRDPTLLYELYRSDEAQAYAYTGNYPGYQNLQFDADGIAFLNAPNVAVAKPLIDEMQLLLAQEVGIIPVFTYASYGAAKSYVQKLINTSGVGPWGWFTFLDAYIVGDDEINWGFFNDVETLNVMHSEWVWDWQILDKIYDTLINVDPYDITIDKPWMAKSWEAGNWTWDGDVATKITFKLREDMYWQDVPALPGRHRPDGQTFLEAGATNVKVTAADVKFSIDYLLANDTNWNWDLVEQVVYCDVTDPYTITVYFDSYMPLWALHKVGGIPIIPKHIWSNIPNVGPNAQSRAFDPIAQRCLQGCGPWEYNYDTSVPHTYYMLDAYHRYFRYHPVDVTADVDVHDSDLDLKVVGPCDTVTVSFYLHNQDSQRVIAPCEFFVNITKHYPDGHWDQLYYESNPLLPYCEEVWIFNHTQHIDDYGPYEIRATITPDPLTGHADMDGYSVFLWSTIPPDMNLDFTTDIFDIVECALAFGAVIGDVNWNPRPDLVAEFGLIDIFDLVYIAINFGWVGY